MCYTIKLSDGKELTNITRNGNNYISNVRIDESIFKNNLKTVIISSDTDTEVYHNLIFVQQVEWEDGTFYLAFREETLHEKESRVITEIEVALAEIYELVLSTF